MDKKQAAHIETQLKELHACIQHLSGGDSVESMVSIIHKPGWTTIAEVAFFTGIVDSMIAHTKAVSSLKQVLLSGAAKVALNPQPLPPGNEVALNPQPLPPGNEVALNPQPLPPGKK